MCRQFRPWTSQSQRSSTTRVPGGRFARRLSNVARLPGCNLNRVPDAEFGDAKQKYAAHPHYTSRMLGWPT